MEFHKLSQHTHLGGQFSHCMQGKKDVKLVRVVTLK